MFTALFGEEYYDALVKGDEGQGQTIEFQDMSPTVLSVLRLSPRRR